MQKLAQEDEGKT